MGLFSGKVKRPNTSTMFSPKTVTPDGAMSLQQFLQQIDYSNMGNARNELVKNNWNLNHSAISPGFKQARENEYNNYLTQYQPKESAGAPAELLGGEPENLGLSDVITETEKPVQRSDDVIKEAARSAMLREKRRRGRGATILNSARGLEGKVLSTKRPALRQASALGAVPLSA